MDCIIKKVLRVNVLLTARVLWINDIDVSEIVGNVQSIISIEDGDDYK